MKSWTKPVAYLSIALCLINSTRTDDSQHQVYRRSNQKFHKFINMVWDADTLIKYLDKNSNDSSQFSSESMNNSSSDSLNRPYKSLYEILLPDSILNKDKNYSDSTGRIRLYFPNELECEMLGLKNSAYKEYIKFQDTRNKSYALKAIAYLQYEAIKYPGTDGTEVELPARRIDEFSREIRKLNTNPSNYRPEF